MHLLFYLLHKNNTEPYYYDSVLPHCVKRMSKKTIV